MMYREEKPSTGSINVNGLTIETLAERDVPYFRRQLGVIFQDFKLLPKLTVYENVSFALEVIEEEPDAIRERVTEVLGLVGLEDRADALPSELSGGEQQRVAIARAIVNRPKVVIADEPTGNLDIETALDIMNIFTRINERGTTIVMATHNADIVNTIRHRVIAIEGGKIVRDEIEEDTDMKAKTLSRHLREGVKNLSRNGWMTFASVSAVTVTLLLVGVF